MKPTTIGFIGGGRITRIFLKAFTNKSAKFDSITVFDTDSNVLKGLKDEFPGIETAGSADMPAGKDIVVLAVHPPAIMEVLGNISEQVNENTIILSLAPKFTIDKIGGKLPSKKVVRMIPNATSYINEGYNPVAFSSYITANERASLMQMFDILGDTFEVEESKLEIYAIFSAMLPTYFWFQWKEMEELASKTGLPENESKKAIAETLKKSIDLFYNSELSQDAVIDLIPVKPIGKHEEEIKNIYNTTLLELFEKIKP